MSDKPAPAARCAVLTIQDPKAQPDAPDSLSDAVVALLQAHGHAIARRWVVPDDPGRIDDALIDFGRDAGADALVILGGTGVGRRESALEAADRRFSKTLEGFAHLFYQLAFQAQGTAALHLRAAAGIASGKPVFALPADRGACELALKALILPELPRLLAVTKAP